MYILVGILFFIANVITIKVLAQYDESLAEDKDSQLMAMFWSLVAIVAWPFELLFLVVGAVIFGLRAVFMWVISIDFSEDKEEK